MAMCLPSSVLNSDATASTHEAACVTLTAVCGLYRLLPEQQHQRRSGPSYMTARRTLTAWIAQACMKCWITHAEPKMRLTQFQGVVPKLRAEKLGQGFASFAENCLLHSGAIVPLVAPSFTADTVNIDGSLRTSPPGSLHRIGALRLGFDDFIPIAEDPIHVAGPDSFLY